MGVLQLKQIEKRLDETVVPFIDVSDLTGHDDEHLRKNQLSRALAAFAISRVWEWDDESSAACITDGSKDNGLDAIAIDLSVPRVMLVQSKWHEGPGSMKKSDMVLFKTGVEDLVNGRRDTFAPSVQARWNEIDLALTEPTVKIHLVCAHSGSGPLSEEVERAIRPILDNLNEFETVAHFQYLGQSDLHSLLRQTSAPIDIDVELSDWGVLEGPAKAFYGHVSTGDVAKWHSEHGDRLFSSNLRSTLPDSAVNDGIKSTLQETPELFWYFNNGITVLSSKIDKAPAGAADRRVGTFKFSGIQVVNGAQTVGSISDAVSARSNGADQGSEPVAADARVLVRFIELEGTRDTFATDVTRWTNTQNRVGGRDFLALDPEQARIANEFAIDDLTYVFRSGEADPEPSKGCGVQEATVALACSKSDIRLAVQAKREVSRLWADIERAPYKTLFNSTTTSAEVWSAVLILRDVEGHLAAARDQLEGRQQSFAIHLNRVVTWIVNQVVREEHPVEALEPSVLVDHVARIAPLLIPHLASLADSEYAGYPANLAKNATECERLARLELDYLATQLPQELM